MISLAERMSMSDLIDDPRNHLVVVRSGETAPEIWIAKGQGLQRPMGGLCQHSLPPPLDLCWADFLYRLASLISQ